MKKDIIIVIIIGLLLTVFVAYSWYTGSVCSLVTRHVQDKQCYVVIAKSTNNFKICDKFDSPYACYIDLDFIAYRTDVSLCEKGKDVNNRDSCYLQVAWAKEDKSICNKINNQNRKDLCIGGSVF